MAATLINNHPQPNYAFNPTEYEYSRRHVEGSGGLRDGVERGSLGDSGLGGESSGVVGRRRVLFDPTTADCTEMCTDSTGQEGKEGDVTVHQGSRTHKGHTDDESFARALGSPKASWQVSQMIEKMDRAAIEEWESEALGGIVKVEVETTPSQPQIGFADEIDSDEEYDDTLVPLSRLDAHALIHQQISRAAEKGDERAFFVGDLSTIYGAVMQWKNSPIGDRVELFYAVKCNPSLPVLHLLSLLGTSFDCASLSEIEMVLNLPTAPKGDRIIFANPCKPASYIRAAKSKGVEMMTFDNADELHKIKKYYPTAKLVLRILTDDSKSLCRLGLKFGSPLEACPGLLSLARQLDLNVMGVSFHVGSGSKDSNQFADAVWRAKQVFKMGKQEGYTFELLDVGGGFEMESFPAASQVLADSLELYFPRSEGVRVIAEPGRLLVSGAFTLAASIIARRRALEASTAMPERATAAALTVVKEDEEEVVETETGADVMFYINDGVYSAFNCIMFDHQIVHPYPLTLGNSASSAIPRPNGPPVPPNVALPTDLSISMGYTETERASVWGPTCDSIDCVRTLVDLPRGLQVGDWLGFGEMGAYTMCAASRFNGMPLSEVHWTTGYVGKMSLEVRKVWESYMQQE